MQNPIRRESGSVWQFLLTAFAAVALAVAVLPGCGDDDTSPDSEYEPEESEEPLCVLRCMPDCSPDCINEPV